MRAALPGVVAATVWGLQEPLDRRVFRCDYSDVRLVGRLPVHALNGALFGLPFAARGSRTGMEPHRLAVVRALAEPSALWPLLGLLEPAVAKSPRAFAQGVYRHALFGYMLGRLA